MICSAQEFVSLRSSDIPEEYLRAASEEAPLEVWHEVINNHPDMLFWVAQNKTVPIAILEILAGDQDERVRSMVAAKSKLPEALQLRLTEDPSPLVRMRLARHKKATSRVLAILATDPNPEIRQVVQERLENRSC